MARIINPKLFLKEARIPGFANGSITKEDLIEIVEINTSLPLIEAIEIESFSQRLKKEISDYNSQAALNGNDLVDFDDLNTKYIEYIEALTTFIS